MNKILICPACENEGEEEELQFEKNGYCKKCNDGPSDEEIFNRIQQYP